MPLDINVAGNKTVRCRNGHTFSIPLLTTYTTCPTCGIGVLAYYFGTVNGQFH